MERQDDISKPNKPEMTSGDLVRIILFWIAVAGFIVAVLTLIVNIISLGGRVTNIQVIVKDTQESVKRVEEEVLSRRFVITTPVEGVTVDFTDIVSGVTPFPNKNNYIVVTPLKTGDDWVQDGPVKISGDGLWTGRAQFGTGEAGVGEKFLVRAIATQATLSPGPLTQVPEDAVFSGSITVTRKQ